MAIKKGDFIELDYTGKVTENKQVFDTTIQKVAEDAGLLHKHEPGHDHDHSDKYSPVVLCVGEKHLLPGLDNKIEGLDLGKHNIKLEDVEAFGKKDPKLLKMIPMNIFKQHKIEPQVGLDLNIDGQLGIIRSVSGGRVIVDFNHPLSSKEIEYDIDIKKVVTDGKTKVEALLKLGRIPFTDLKVDDKNASFKVSAPLPNEFVEMLSKDFERLTGLKIKIIAETVKEEVKKDDESTKKNEPSKASTEEKEQ